MLSGTHWVVSLEVPKTEKVCNLLGPLQESFGPFGPEIPKKSKKGSRGQKRLKKSRTKVEKVEKRLFLSRFQLFSTFFNLFWPRGREAPGTFFRLLLGFRARRARMTPVRGQGGCKKRLANKSWLISIEMLASKSDGNPAISTQRNHWEKSFRNRRGFGDLGCEWGRQLQNQNSEVVKVIQKWLKSDFSGPTWKWLQNDSKVTFGVIFVLKKAIIESLLCHFRVAFRLTPKSHLWVILASSYFSLSLGSVAAVPIHKSWGGVNFAWIFWAGEFQVTVCGVTVCPFSRHKGNQRPKCL